MTITMTMEWDLERDLEWDLELDNITQSTQIAKISLKMYLRMQAGY